jgi:hypothetical protein
MNAALAGHDVLPEVDPQFMQEQGFGGESPAKYASDNRLHVTFSRKPILNAMKSTQEGRAIYEERDYITIYTPGSQLSVIEAPVTERDYAKRFGARYKAWLENQKEAVIGTPLESWPFMFNKVALVAELKYMNVHTVEQIANLPDVHLQKLMGGHELRAKAVEWLDKNFGADAQLTKMSEEAAKAKEELEVVKEQLAQLMAKMPATMSATKSEVPKAVTK